jgi:membrane protein implicated in regulation of membrane protease activity
MTSGTVNRVLVLAVLVVGLVGLLDAAIGRTWDLTVLFAVVAVLASVLLLRGLGDRRTVDLRADLAAALTGRSRRTGEPVDQVVDRAVATYLAALADPDEASPR